MIFSSIMMEFSFVKAEIKSTVINNFIIFFVMSKTIILDSKKMNWKTKIDSNYYITFIKKFIIVHSIKEKVLFNFFRYFG